VENPLRVREATAPDRQHSAQVGHGRLEIVRAQFVREPAHLHQPLLGQGELSPGDVQADQPEHHVRPAGTRPDGTKDAGRFGPLLASPVAEAVTLVRVAAQSEGEDPGEVVVGRS
jgi:hypothetical protein